MPVQFVCKVIPPDIPIPRVTPEEFHEVCAKAFGRGVLDGNHFKKDKGKPGEFLASLPEDMRDKLASLTSDQAKNVRFDAIKNMCHPPLRFY